MQNDDYLSAQAFFGRIITPEDIMSVDVLLKKIIKAPPAAKRYLERYCRDAKELEEFFKDNNYLFYIENKKVTVFDEQLERVIERTVELFQENLKQYGKPMGFLELKGALLDHAPRNVCRFISQFYPGTEIKHFFKQRPNIFSVHKGHTVFLVEIESVAFYRRKLKARNGQKEHFVKFRGVIGQADPHIQKYINKNFLGDDFQEFLIRNNDVFRLDDNGFVSLVN